ncbi:SapC family protein [Rheinheimera baltica]|uniref:SapC family protein n=1 Tax=Rheinheimera baltica TaxID=67576 RepID=A0ABT9HYL2_9GAMM|nr:SapC family protein [Rheinheimera baltica]MDP5136223.1 SapC family protein [Rheinheimera baltica]MDP5149500.1 SapC family protein [Rheinheimera baltica]MDP5189414.1 SapC family protein [Rheinheimera baltica]
MNAITPLTKEVHGTFKLASDTRYPQVKTEHLLPVVVHEFTALALEYAIVFVKNAETGAFQSVLLTGLNTGQNLYFSEKGWQADAVPLVVRNYPLLLIQDPNDEQQLLVGVNESSTLLNASEGDALFDADGNETHFLQQRKQKLADFLKFTQVTAAFITSLTELNLLAPQKLTVTVQQNKQELNGLYLLDEDKLNALDTDSFSSLRQRGFLAPIYAHLMSLRNIERLVKKAAKQGE